MIKNETLLLGGQERPLKFGGMGFFKYAGEVYSGDPTDLVSSAKNPKEQYDRMVVVIYAGLKCAGGTDEFEQVESWVQDLPIPDAARIRLSYLEAYAEQNGSPGEVEARELVNA